MITASGEWLDHAPVSADDIDARWFGRTLALLHTLCPMTELPESEWRWLGVYPMQQWQTWLAAARAADKSWVAPVEDHLQDIDAVTGHIRRLYETSTDLIISHRDLGPWNVLRTPDGLRLIDWENAGPITATLELGRALLAFGCDDPTRMRELIAGYRAGGGRTAGRPEDLFGWQLTQQLSQITERIKISVGDLDGEDDPDPVWMDASTLDADIVDAVTTLRPTVDQHAETASRL